MRLRSFLSRWVVAFKQNLMPKTQWNFHFVVSFLPFAEAWFQTRSNCRATQGFELGGSRHPLFLLPIFHHPFSTPAMHRLPCRIQTLPRVVPIHLAAEDHTLALPDPSPLHNARHNAHAWFQPDEDPLVDRTWVPFQTRTPGSTPIRLVELVWSVW